MSTRILVIDDDEGLRDNIATRLEFEGYTVAMAKNGIEGIERIQTHHPALVLCDVNMPGMDGYEVLSEVRSLPGFARTPFLFLTAQTGRNAIRKGMVLGADDYITKPFDDDDLVSAIQARLQRHLQTESAILQSFAHLMIERNDRFKQQIADYIQSEVMHPLNAMRMRLHLLMQQSSDNTHQNLSSEVTAIINTIEYLHTLLVTDTLLYLGVVPMVQWLVIYYQTSGNLDIQFQHHNLQASLPHEILRHLFAVLDEALHNVVQHAHATNVTITLHQSENQVRGSVSDNGSGLNVQELWQNITSLGIVTMRERVHLCNGQFDILSDTNTGTIVHFSLSLEVDTLANFNFLPLSLQQPSIASPTVDGKPQDVKYTLLVHDNELILRGIRQLVTSENDLSVVASCQSMAALLNVLADRLPVDVVVISVSVWETATSEQLTRLFAYTRNLIVISNANTSLNEDNIDDVMGYMTENQLVDCLTTGIRTVLNGQRYIITETKSSDGDERSLETLTVREREILDLIANNHRNADIAEELLISIRTVETHRANIMNKLNLKDKSELILFALKHGVISLDD